MGWKKYLSWAGWGLAIILALLYYNARQITPDSTLIPVNDVAQTEQAVNDKLDNADASNDVPIHALKTLEYVRKFNQAPEGYVGGRKFYNREKQLPKSDNGQTINYREWDVWPKENGKNRGAERLVTGDNKTAYYTQNHYKTFTEIK
jgi:ribonuclease T1